MDGSLLRWLSWVLCGVRIVDERSMGAHEPACLQQEFLLEGLSTLELLGACSSSGRVCLALDPFGRRRSQGSWLQVGLPQAAQLRLASPSLPSGCLGWQLRSHRSRGAYDCSASQGRLYQGCQAARLQASCCESAVMSLAVPVRLQASLALQSLWKACQPTVAS